MFSNGEEVGHLQPAQDTPIPFSISLVVQCSSESILSNCHQVLSIFLFSTLQKSSRAFRFNYVGKISEDRDWEFLQCDWLGHYARLYSLFGHLQLLQWQWPCKRSGRSIWARRTRSWRNMMEGTKSNSIVLVKYGGAICGRHLLGSLRRKTI